MRQQADELGFSYGEYLVALAAKALDMPQFTPPPSKDRRVELDFHEEAATDPA